MIDRLEARFADDVVRARRYTGGDDPLVVLEALGYAVVLHSVGLLESTSPEDRAALVVVAADAIAAARGAGEDDDEREAYEAAAHLAELGYRVAAGKPAGDLSRLPSDAADPTDRQIVRMLTGQLDGVSAAYTAVRCLKRADPRPTLLVSVARRNREQSVPAAPVLSLAAADPARVRAPERGRFVGSFEDTLLEAVYFPTERQLAIYCATAEPLRVVAAGVTPKDMKPGYWLGDVDPTAAQTLELDIAVGARRLRWAVSLG